MLAFDLEGSILSAEATVLGAIRRKESRGAHQRDDFTKMESKFSLNFNTKFDSSNKLQTTSSKLKELRPELGKAIKSTKSITDYSGMLLE